MLRRSIWSELVAWKGRPGHHPLVVEGLRQVGKTYIVREFGSQMYKHVVYLDLRAGKALHAAFDGDFSVDEMTLSITALDPEARFVPGETLLILDEVQDCPNARSSLKYWDLDGRYDVIATGSFLGVKGFRKPYDRGIPVGYEEHLPMFPLSFREFLDNAGVPEDVMSHVAASLAARSPVLAAIHERMRTLYLQYLVVGGMPEAVNVFFETHDLNAVLRVQRAILASIRDDFGRYRDARGNDAVNEVLKLRAEACLDSLPTQLAKKYKKFQYSLVNARGKSAQKADGLQYILDVGIAVRAFNLREISSPLEGAKIADEFKVFCADTGLLVSMLESGTAAKVLAGDLSAYKGAIAENMVASACAQAGLGLYYLHDQSGSPELDFVINIEGKPTLIECKSRNGRMTSMRFVIDHPKRFGAHPAIKFADTNVGGGRGFTTLPLYAIGFLEGEGEQAIVEPVTFEDLPGF